MNSHVSACGGRHRSSGIGQHTELPLRSSNLWPSSAFRRLAAHGKCCRKQQRCQKRPSAALELFESAQLAGDAVKGLFSMVATATPAPLQPAVQVIGADLSGLIALQPTLPGLARLGVRMDPLVSHTISPASLLLYLFRSWAHACCLLPLR
jgi:hypothetical protein